MNPDRIVLETMMQMRQHLPRSLAQTKKGTRLPISSLRVMCIRFGVTWAATYTHPVRSGPFIRAQLVGRPVDRHLNFSESELRSEFTGDSRTLIPFEHKPTARGQAIGFGFLALERESGFAYDDIVALRHACSFAAAYIYEMMEAACLFAIEKVRNQISRTDEISSPGTTIVRLLNNIHRCTRSHISAYATISDNAICIEYKAAEANKTTNIVPRIMDSGLPLQVLTTISRRDVSVWSDLDDKVLTTFISEALGWHPMGPQYVLAVHRVGSQPIALWILGIERGRFFLGHSCRELLAEVTRYAQTSSQYLFQRRYGKLIVNPIFGSRNTRVDPSLLFALMPFNEPWSDRIWEKMIKPIAQECGLQAKRADDLFGRDIMEDIWSSILAARVVVADITSRNPNVFYELGIAHTLGKSVVLLTQSVSDIPFDLNRYRHIIYSDNLDGYEVLTKQLRSTISELIPAKNA